MMIILCFFERRKLVLEFNMGKRHAIQHSIEVFVITHEGITCKHAPVCMNFEWKIKLILSSSSYQWTSHRICEILATPIRILWVVFKKLWTTNTAIIWAEWVCRLVVHSTHFLNYMKNIDVHVKIYINFDYFMESSFSFLSNLFHIWGYIKRNFNDSQYIYIFQNKV